MARALTTIEVNPLQMMFETQDDYMVRKAQRYLSLELNHNGPTELSDILAGLLSMVEKERESQRRRMEVQDG